MPNENPRRPHERAALYTQNTGLHNTIMVLSQFREFNVWLKECDRPQVSKTAISKVYRAHARHRVAKRFRDLRIHDASDALLRGYSVGIRTFLCYSAAEAMGAAIEKHVSRWTIHDESIAPALRRIAEPLRDRTDVLKGTARGDLIKFVDHEHENVRVVATAFRHLVAHGDFTPTGTGMMTVAGANAVLRLGDLMLTESERQFTAWFTRISGA